MRTCMYMYTEKRHKENENSMTGRENKDTPASVTNTSECKTYTTLQEAFRADDRLVYSHDPAAKQ